MVLYVVAHIFVNPWVNLSFIAICASRSYFYTHSLNKSLQQRILILPSLHHKSPCTGAPQFLSLWLHINVHEKTVHLSLNHSFKFPKERIWLAQLGINVHKWFIQLHPGGRIFLRWRRRRKGRRKRRKGKGQNIS